jgi:hypothetical protein
MQFLAVDIGASNTRYVGSNAKVKVLPNNMAFIPTSTVVDLETEGSKVEDALDCVITAKNENGTFQQRVLIGSLARRFSPNNLRPENGSRRKFEQPVNIISVVVSAALAQIHFQIEEEIKLYLALPPSEVTYSKEEARKAFMGEYTVELLKFGGGLTKKVHIVDCVVRPEAALSLTSFFFGMDGQPRPEAEPYESGTVMSMDIGASTVDFCIAQDCRFIESSARTYKGGGNLAIEYLINRLSGEKSIQIPRDIAEKVMAEGRIFMNNKYVDVSDIVVAAKQELANTIVMLSLEYFNSIQTPISLINAAIVSGGGSLKSSYVDDAKGIVETSEPISGYILEAFKEKAPGIIAVDHSDAPRYANIHGLYTIAMFDAYRQKAAGTQPAPAKVEPANTSYDVFEPLVGSTPSQVTTEQSSQE